KIAFESQLVKFVADTLLKVPDTSIYIPYPFPFGYFTYNPNDSFALSNSSNNESQFAIKNVQLHFAKVRSGKCSLHVESSLKQPSIFNCQLTSATKSGIKLNINLPLKAGTIANPAKADTIIDLSNYDLDLRGNSGNKYNTLVKNLQIKIAPNAQPDSVKYGQSVNTTVTFLSIVPEYGQGYFGNQTIKVGPSTTVFDIFNKIKAGNLNLNSANLQLKVINDFGIDMQAKINSITSINSVTNNTVTMTGSPIAGSFNVNRAINTGIPSNPIIPTTKILNLTNLNSNIVNFIDNLPSSIGYSLSAQLNPFGNISGSNDFAYYGTSLTSILSVDIPLNFSATNITLKDTVKIDFSNISRLNNVNYGNLLLHADNSYPFSLNVQGYLLDGNNHVVDSLFDNLHNTVASALLDINNKVISANTSILKIPINQDKLNKLRQSKKIYFTSKFNTANQPAHVQFYSNYKLDLLLTADINYSVNK
ncbi:MAG TPA: hypothetical protein VNX68_16760, partial [Nitrosopumilaceae archaeon]|nr:hypothetical protein [Nitrosopumilaceae archaeon]